MWQSLSKKCLLTVIVTVSVLLFISLFLLLDALESTPSFITTTRSIGLITLILDVGFVTFFNWKWKWIWKKLPFLSKHVFPDISGQWIGEFKWSDGDGASHSEPIKTLSITQNWSQFKIYVETANATSMSLTAWVEKDVDLEQATLSYLYLHTPKEINRLENPPHKGTAKLIFSLTAPSTATGAYYTERKSAGDIKIRKK